MNARIKKESKTTETSGAERSERVGKGRYDLLPFRAIDELAKHMEAGVTEGGYEARNWEKGMRISRLLDGTLRHLGQAVVGLTDEPHWRAALWNLTCLIDTMKRIEEGILSVELADLPCFLPDKVKESKK